MCGFGKKKTPKVEKADDTIAKREAAAKAEEERQKQEWAKMNGRRALNMPLDTGDSGL